MYRSKVFLMKYRIKKSHGRCICSRRVLHPWHLIYGFSLTAQSFEGLHKSHFPQDKKFRAHRSRLYVVPLALDSVQILQCFFFFKTYLTSSQQNIDKKSVRPLYINFSKDMKCLKSLNLIFFFCKQKEKKISAMSSQNYNIHQSQSVMQLNSAFNVNYHRKDETSELSQRSLHPISPHFTGWCNQRTGKHSVILHQNSCFSFICKH